MLTTAQLNHVADILKAMAAGKTIQTEGLTRWHDQTHEYILMCLDGRFAYPQTENLGLRIKPEPVRLYFSPSRLYGISATRCPSDTHYIDLHEDGSITGGKL